MSVLKKAGQAALRRLDRGLEVAEHVLTSYDEAVKWRREAHQAKEDAEGWRHRAMVLSRRQKEWAAARAEAVAKLGRWKERVEPAEARAAELAAEVGALKERLAEVPHLEELRELDRTLGISGQLTRLTAERDRHQRGLNGLIERVCGLPNMTLDDAYAALGTLKAQRDGAQRDAHHFREQAIHREEELHRLKEVAALKREEAVRQAVEADRAAVAEWLVGLKLQHAADAGRALRGDLEWLPPPPLPPVNSSKISNGSTNVAGRVAAEALTESIKAMGPHLHEGEALPDGIRRLVAQVRLQAAQSSTEEHGRVARWAHDVFGKAAE